MTEGIDLKKIRESKGLTLEEISQKTRIRPAFLAAIEEGRYQELPEKYYAETFIKTYTNMLGVDPAPFLARCRQAVDKTAAPDREELPRKESQPPRELPKKKREESSKPARGPSWLKRHYKLTGWMLSCVLVLAVLVCQFYPNEAVIEVPAPPQAVQKPVEPLPPQSAPTGEEAQKVEAPPAAPKETLEPRKEAPAAQGTEQPRKNLQIKIEATETAWMRIKEDRESPRQYLLQPGDKLSRQANARFEIDIGNAGGVRVDFQGKPLGPLGKSGEVVHLILPEEPVVKMPPEKPPQKTPQPPSQPLPLEKQQP